MINTLFKKVKIPNITYKKHLMVLLVVTKSNSNLKQNHMVLTRTVEQQVMVLLFKALTRFTNQPAPVFAIILLRSPSFLRLIDSLSIIFTTITTTRPKSLLGLLTTTCNNLCNYYIHIHMFVGVVALHYKHPLVLITKYHNSHKLVNVI